jgi:hypothetical protein
MDSTVLANHLISIKEIQYTIKTDLDKIDGSVKKLLDAEFIDKLLPVISLIAGAVLTYLVQLWLKNRDNKVKNDEKIDTVIYNLKYHLQMVKFYIKEIAYLEVDSKYQYYLYQKLKGELKQRALEEHYGNYKYLSENRSKLSDAVAKINAEFSSYYKISKVQMPLECSQLILQFMTHMRTLRRYHEFDKSKEVDEAKFSLAEKTLTAEYSKHINELISFVDQLPSSKN